MLRVAGFQTVKHEIDGVLEILVVLSRFAGIYHVKQRRKVHLILRRFVPDIADQRRIV
ncbi:hypothetical protein SDC9_109140 [bioreactor metagenome]|uniref:Uncharacterized protein n=1 Tax=bioreactor metagenome TaxID=1076179 RepID=A0A645BKF1_9ZZZZ